MNLYNLVNNLYETLVSNWNKDGLITKLEKFKKSSYLEILKYAISNTFPLCRLGEGIVVTFRNLEEINNILYERNMINEREYRKNRMLVKIGKITGRIINIGGAILLGFSIFFGIYSIYKHSLPLSLYPKYIGIDSEYLAIVRLKNGTFVVLADKNGQIIGKFNDIIYHNQYNPFNPVDIIEKVNQFNQQYNSDLNYSIILYFPSGHGTLHITNNGYIDLSNFYINRMAVVVTPNQYLIPLIDGILSENIKTYTANLTYLYYYYPNLSNASLQLINLQDSIPILYGNALAVYNGTVIPFGLTPTSIPIFISVSNTFYNGSS